MDNLYTQMDDERRKTGKEVQQKQMEREANRDLYNISVPDEVYELWNKAIANSEDPEETAHKFGTALRYSDMFGIGFDDALENIDTYNDLLWGHDENRTYKGNWKAVCDSWKAGLNSMRQAQLGNLMKNAIKDGDEELQQTIWNEYNALREENEQLSDTQPRHWTIEALKAGAQSTPYTAASGAANLFGQLVGVGVLKSKVAGEILSNLGTVGASTWITGGQEYMDLLSKGVRPEIAGPASLISGVIQGGIEAALGKSVSLAASAAYATIGKSAGKGVSKSVINSIVNSAQKKWHFGNGTKMAVATIMRYLADIPSEGLEEGAQGITSSIVGNIGIRLENKARRKEAAEETEKRIAELEYNVGKLADEAVEILKKEVESRDELAELKLSTYNWDDAWNDIKGGMLGAIVLGIPSTGMNIIGDARQLHEIKKAAQSIPSEKVFIDTMMKERTTENGDTYTYADVLGIEDKQDLKNTLHEIHQGQANVRQETNFAQLSDITEINTAEEGYADYEEDPGTGDQIITPVSRTDTGSIAAEDIEISSDNGIVNRQYRIGDTTKENKNLYGYIDYAVDEKNKTITINKFSMDYNREGIRLEVYDQFAEKAAGYDIIWNAKSKRGKAIKEYLTNYNPNGKNNGITYYKNENDLLDRQTRKDVAKQIKENIPSIAGDNQQVAAAVAYAEAIAKNRGESLNSWINRTFVAGKVFGTQEEFQQAAEAQGEKVEDKRGAQQWKKFGEEFKAVIYTGQKADFSTWIHELSHIWQQQLLRDAQNGNQEAIKQIAQMEKAFNVINHDWDNSQFTFADGTIGNATEALAYGAEQYLMSGKGNDTDLKELYSSLARFIARVYNGLKNFINFNNDIIETYENYLKGNDSMLKLAEEGVLKADKELYYKWQNEQQQAQQEATAQELEAKKAEREQQEANEEVNYSTEEVETFNAVDPEAAENAKSFETALKDNTPDAEQISAEVEKISEDEMGYTAEDALQNVEEYTQDQKIQEEVQAEIFDAVPDETAREYNEVIQDSASTVTDKIEASQDAAENAKNYVDPLPPEMHFQRFFNTDEDRQQAVKEAVEYLKKYKTEAEYNRIMDNLEKLHYKKKGSKSKKLEETGWYKMAIDSAVLQRDIEEALEGKPLRENSWIVEYNNFMKEQKGSNEDLASYKAFVKAAERAKISRRLAEQVFIDYVKQTGILGTNDKCVLDINGSILNCNPSEGCASGCYVFSGNLHYSDYNSMVKSELVNWFVENYPREAAAETARAYAVYQHDGYALRLFDKGDISEKWIPYIEELNFTHELRLQIFSKRPDLLKQVDNGMNRTMLSKDATNRDFVRQYPEFDKSIWLKDETQFYLVEEEKDSFDKKGGLILFDNSNRLKKAEKTWMMVKEADPELMKYLCPRQLWDKTHTCLQCQHHGSGCWANETTKAGMQDLIYTKNEDTIKEFEEKSGWLNEERKRLIRDYIREEQLTGGNLTRFLRLCEAMDDGANQIREEHQQGTVSQEFRRADGYTSGGHDGGGLDDGAAAEEINGTRLHSQILGELGATNLDRAQEVSIRMDTKAIAEEMEEAGKDPEIIYAATGWERGTDNLWRYEASDFVIGDNVEDNFMFKNDKFASIYLEELIGFTPENDNNLFIAYPRLKSIVVRFVPPSLMDPGTLAYFNPNENAIYFPRKAADNLAGMRSTLAHEIQHVIQDEEGFGVGGNPEMFESKMINVSELEEEIQGHQNNLKGWYKDIGLDAFTRQSVEEMNAGKKTLEQHWQDLQEFKDNSEYSEQIKKEENRIAELRDRIDEINENALDGSVEVDGQIYGSPMMAYSSLAGEVEARNVQRRLGMSFDERMNTMIAATEDIDRDHQIVYRQQLRMASIAEANAQQNEVREKYEGTDQWLKAPNGKDTNLSEKQWIQVRTDNFKKWFGDWENDPANASKVVDENGEPLVVYRGQDWKENDYVPGDFVSTEELFAEGYGDVEAVFVNSRKPFNGVEDAEQLRDFIKENEEALIEEYDYFFEGDGGYTSADEIMDALKENWWIAYEQSEIVASEISKRGYDSIWIQEDGVDNIWLRGASMKSATINNGNFDAGDSRINFQVVHDQQEIDDIFSEGSVKAYAAMQIDTLNNEDLYPPMAKVIEGKNQEPARVGSVVKSEEHPEIAYYYTEEGGATKYYELDPANGTPKLGEDGEIAWYFTLKKGGKDSSGENLKDIPARYNPYNHSTKAETALSVINDQFSSAYKRPNIVIVEVEIPVKDLNSGYKAEKAKDSVGETKWHEGPVSAKLNGTPDERVVILSQYRRIVRVLSNAEVAELAAPGLKKYDITVPDNTVPPSLLQELENRGVNIEYTQMVKDYNAGLEEKRQVYKEKLERQIERAEKKMLKDSVKGQEMLQKAMDQMQRMNFQDKINIDPKRKNELTNAFSDISFSVLEDPYAGEQETTKAEEEINKIRNGTESRKIDGNTTGDKASTHIWSILKEIEEHKTSEIIGKQIETSLDGQPTNNGWMQLRDVFDIYRNKSFETFRYVLLDKNGNIVNHLAVSAKMPGRTFNIPHEKGNKFWLDLLNEVYSNDYKVVVVHNHPSGNIKESLPDINATNKLILELGDNYAGHMILDHNSFNLNLYDGKKNDWKIFFIGDNEEDNLLKAPEEHEQVFNKKIFNTDVIDSLGKTLADIDNQIALFYLNHDNFITALEYVTPEKFNINNLTELSKHIIKNGINYGAYGIITYCSDNKIAQFIYDHRDALRIFDNNIKRFKTSEMVSLFPEPYNKKGEIKLTRGMLAKQVYSSNIPDYNNLNFQTMDQLYADARMYNSWEEFEDAYAMQEAFDTDGTVDHSQVPSGADSNWYKTTWEMAKAVIPEESLNKTAVELENERSETPETTDQLFLTQLQNDPNMLKDFMARIGELNKINFNSQEYSRPADAEEQAYFEHLASLQDLINTRLSDVTVSTNATRIANGEEVSKPTLRSILSRIKNNPREYRSLYAQLMGEDKWQVEDKDLPRKQIEEGAKKFRLVSPNEDLDRKSIDEIRRLAAELDNRELREKAKNGTLTMGDEDSRYIKILETDNKRLQEDYDELQKSITDDFQRISDAQTRRLLELHEELLQAKENYDKQNDNVARLIDKGLKITGQYANKVRQLKFTYDDVWNKYDDLYNSIAINDQVKKLLSLQEEKAKLKNEIQKKQDEKAIASEIKKYRVQLVKRAMRRVPFEKVDYEYARTIIAIQRMLEPNLFGGVNRWIGTEGPYLRSIMNNILSDPEYKADILQYLTNHSKSSAAFIRFKDLLSKTENMEQFNSWTEKDREAAIGYLPKEDWIRDLNLKKLAKEREDSIDIDINQVKKSRPMRDKEGNVIRNSKGEPVYAVTFEVEVDKEIEALVRDAVGDTMYNNIVSRPFAEWTMEEMEQLSIRISQLYRTGADVRAAKKVAEIEAAAKIRMAIENAVKNTGIVINDDDPPEVKQQKEEKINKILGLDNSLKGTSVQQKKENKFNRLLHGYADATVLRVARILDNYKEGDNVTELFHKENVCYENKQTALNERAIKIQQVMKDNNIDFDLLNKQVEVGGHMYTVDDLLYFLAADEDYADSEKLVAKGQEPGTLEANDDYAATSRNAVMFGTLLSANEDQTAKEYWREMDRKMQLRIANNELTTAEKELDLLGLLETRPGTAAYIKACKTRYREVLAAAMNVEAENPELSVLRDAIAEDYAQQYEKLNKVSIEEFNQPVHRTRCYVPLTRQEGNGDTNANKVKDDLLASSGSQTQWVDKGMAKRRVNMSPLNQKPVITGLYKTWNNSAERTEHFIAYAGYVRELNRVYKSNDSEYTRRFIEARYGKGMMNYIDQYINETANPDANNVRTAGDNFIRTLRGKTAPAYLAWKLSAVVKQGCTSPWPYMQFVSPAEYLAASWKMITSKGELYDAVRQKSVFMNNRTMDPMNDLVSEMLENAKNGFDRNLAKFNATGMKGLEWIDWISVAPGWYACYLKKYKEVNGNNQEVYENEKLRLLSENTFYDVGSSEYLSIEKIEALANQAMADDVERQAVEYADQCTRECQPSSRAADIAPLFKNSSEAMKAYLQFQTSLNVIWNNIRYDLPYAVKQKQFGRMIGMIAGYVLAGIMMNAVMEGWHNDDKDDKETEKAVRDFIWYSTTQFTDSVPVLGSTLTTASQKLITGKTSYFGGSGTDMTPMVTKFVNAATSASTAIAKSDDPEKAKKAWLKAAANFTEGVNMNFGLPVSGLKEIEKLAGIGDGDGKMGVNFDEVYGILKNIEGKENK